MSESDQTTIPIRVPQPFLHVPAKSVLVRTGMKMPRILVIAVFSIGVLIIGGGVWRYVHRPSGSDDTASISDLDEFESEFSSLSSPVNVNGLGADTGQKKSSATIPKSSATALTLGTTAASSAIDGSSNQAEVWLTGTIEDDEPQRRSNLPRRISGGPTESSSFR